MYNIKWIICIQNSAVAGEHKKRREKTDSFLDIPPRPFPANNDTDFVEPLWYDSS